MGTALVTGRNRVPRPAAGITAFLTGWRGYHGRNSNTAPRCGQRRGGNRQGPAHVGVYSYTPLPVISRPYTDMLLLPECSLCCYPLPMNKLPRLIAPSQTKQARKRWDMLANNGDSLPPRIKKRVIHPKRITFTPEIPLASQYSFLKSNHPTKLMLTKRVPGKSARFQYGFSIVCLD